ncbi:MAG: alpha/beta fold hydrolase [Kiritimatiellae bacterium]|nr:alpha/beta fold hydrolase [Kiritimatiellia bacterium]
MKTFVLNGWASSPRAWDLCGFRRDRLFGYIEQLDGAPEKAVSREDRVVLVGWSMGGSSALGLACMFPGKLAGLVLVAATPRMMRDEGWAGMSDRRLAALEVGLRMTKGEGFFGVSEGKPNPYMMDSEENLERGLAYLKETDLRRPLEDLAASGAFDCPVFVFQSERDGIVRPENASYLKSVFPQAEVAMVPGSEHALPIEIPEKIDAAVRSCQARIP